MLSTRPDSFTLQLRRAFRGLSSRLVKAAMCRAAHRELIEYSYNIPIIFLVGLNCIDCCYWWGRLCIHEAFWFLEVHRHFKMYVHTWQERVVLYNFRALHPSDLLFSDAVLPAHSYMMVFVIWLQAL